MDVTPESAVRSRGGRDARHNPHVSTASPAAESGPQNPSENRQHPPAQKKSRAHWLYIAVIVAVLAGIVVGLVAPGVGQDLKVLGTIFVSLIKMMIAPIILCTIVLGIGYGGYIALMPAVMASIFGPVGLGATLGALYTSAAIGGLLGPALIGALIDATSYSAGIIAAMVITALSAMSLFFIDADRAHSS